MSLLAFCVSKGFWGGMQMICFSLVCLRTNSDSVKKEMHKWHSVESASVSAKWWQNVSFRSKSLEMALIATLRPAKKHIFAIIEKACCFSKGACCCVVVSHPGRLTEMKLLHLPLKTLRGCCDLSYRMRGSMWRIADVCVLSPSFLGGRKITLRFLHVKPRMW